MALAGLFHLLRHICTSSTLKKGVKPFKLKITIAGALYQGRSLVRLKKVSHFPKNIGPKKMHFLKGLENTPF